MKKSNLKKDYEIREMRKSEIQEFLSENQELKLYSFEDEKEYFMIRKGKSSLFIIHEIQEEKKERRVLDRDIKIDSKKVDSFGIKLIYHRDKNGDKEFRIFVSWKDESGKLIRRRLRNQEIDAISRDEKKMIEYFQNLDSSKRFKKDLKIS